MVSTNNISYKFSWSGEVITTTVIGLFFLIGSICLMLFLNFEDSSKWIKWPLLSVLIITIGFALVYMPRNLSIESDELKINMLLVKKRYLFKDIRSVEQIEGKYISNSVRLFGNGGLLGLIGKFKNKNLGSFTMYATSTNKDLILITLNNGKKIVTNCNYVVLCGLRLLLSKY